MGGSSRSLVVCTTNTTRIHTPAWLSAQQTQPEYTKCLAAAMYSKVQKSTKATQQYRQQNLLSCTDNKTYSAVQTKPTQQYRKQNLLSHTDNKTYSSGQMTRSTEQYRQAVTTKPTQQYRQQNLLSRTGNNKTYSAGQTTKETDTERQRKTHTRTHTHTQSPGAYPNCFFMSLADRAPVPITSGQYLWAAEGAVQRLLQAFGKPLHRHKEVREPRLINTNNRVC